MMGINIPHPLFHSNYSEKQSRFCLTSFIGFMCWYISGIQLLLFHYLYMRIYIVHTSYCVIYPVGMYVFVFSVYELNTYNQIY